MRTLTTLFFALALFVPAIRAAATDLKVTDSRGPEVTVTGASIDYGGSLGSDKVEDAIRIQGVKRASAAMLRVGAMKLKGRTDPREYSIDLDRVRAIAPVR